MGVVYRARHIHMKNLVALKVLHQEMTVNQEVVARFEREAVAAARVEHPNVAKATDFGRTDAGAFYLALEFVEGQRLTEVMARHERLPEQRAISIASQILDALCAAHEAGIVHRDLKPDNVMLVERSGGPDLVKVLDFGVAKLVMDEGQKLTQVGTVFGTPEYMSPEQAQGGSVDARADLYAVGVMLYEMLSGNNPFRSGDLIAVLGRQMTLVPPRLPPEVSDELNAFVMELLQKKPEHRVQTAALARDRVRSFLKPPSAVSPPLWRRLKGATDSVRERLSAAGPKLGALPSKTRDRAAVVVRSVQAQIGRALSRPRMPTFDNAASRLFDRRSMFGGRMPNWVLVASLGGLLTVAGFIAALGFFYGSEPPSPERSHPPVREGSKAPELPLEKAARGDRSALDQVAKVPEAERSAEHWRVLGAGFSKTRRYEASLAAYEQALLKEPRLGERDSVLADVAKLATHAPLAERALQLMLALGPRGADVVFDTWRRTRKDKARAGLSAVAKKMAFSENAKERASPALRVALKLYQGRACKSFKAVLPQAAQHSDRRSLPVLLALERRKGCGLLNLQDCYGCLRENGDLKRAIARARATEAPRLPHSIFKPAPVNANQ